MQVNVLPGAVKEVVAVSEWLDFHIAIYRSISDDLVILHDDQLLQILPLPASSVSIHPVTGHLAICARSKLNIYEPVLNFGELPYWIRAYVADLPDISCAVWLTETRLLLSDTAKLIVWDSREQIKINEQALSPISGLTSNPHSGEAVIYHRDSTKVIKFTAFEGENWDFEVFDVGKSVVLRAFLVPGSITIIHTENCWFLYHKTQLVASIPNCDAVIYPLNDEKIRIQIARQPLYEINVRSTPPTVNKTAIISQLPEGSNIWNTRHRVYQQCSTSLQIFDLNGLLLSTFSGVCNSRSSTCMAFGGNYGLLGSTIITTSSSNDFNCESSVECHAVLACFIDNYRICIIDDSNVLHCFVKTKPVWSTPLLKPSPLALSSNGDKILVVFQDHYSIFDTKSGKGQSSIEFPHVGKVDACGETLALCSGDELTVLNGNESSSDDKSTVFTVDSRIDVVALSPDGMAIVGNGTNFRCLSIKNPGYPGNAFETSEPISDIKWNGDGTLVGILTAQRVSVYAKVPIIKGLLHKLYDITEPFKFVGPRARIGWKGDKMLVLFDGKQVWYSTIDLPSDLNSPLPIYHPLTLKVLSEALQITHLVDILTKLGNELKFCDHNENGWAILDPRLQLRDLESKQNSHSNPNISTVDTQGILSLMAKRGGIVGLNAHEFSQLQKIVEYTSHLSRLDAFAFCSLLLEQVFHESTESWIYAWFSDTKLELSSEIGTKYHVWLDVDSLKSEIEQDAKVEFAKERDPTAVTLQYLVLHKLQVVQTLWRIAGGHPEREKTIKLLKNDFSTERWRSAALKNAYALLSKHRDAYAAAFFLLGNSVVDCCQVCVSKLHDVTLAIVIARVYSDSKSGIEALEKRFINNGEFWLAFWCSILLGSPLKIESSDPSSAIISVLFAGGSKSELNCPGIDSIVSDVIIKYVEPHKYTGKEEKEETTEKPLPSHLKPPPDLQLEPDMSAFGF